MWLRHCCSMTEGAGMLNAGVGIAPGWWSLQKRQFQFLSVKSCIHPSMYFGWTKVENCVFPSISYFNYIQQIGSLNTTN